MDDIDFSLTLHEHGWTTFLLSVDQSVYELMVSGALSAPLYDLANVCLALLDGEEYIALQWYDEPGGHSLHITRDKIQHHLLLVEISSFAGEGKGYEKVISFVIKQRQFLVIALLQLKKNYLLLMEKSFAKDRQHEFPYELYDRLMQKEALVTHRLM